MRHRRLAGLLAVLVPFMFVACSGASPSSAPSSTPAAAPSSAGTASAAASASTELLADIDVGGRTLHLVCLGPVDTGTPTIVFEAGLGAPYAAWSDILTVMQSSRRICAYDRAGLGQSPPAPEPSRTTEDVVADLHTLLTKAGVAGPYLMVGHSFGAWPVTLYASNYVDDVAGIVFVDPRGSKVSAEWRDALPAPAASEDPAIAANRDELGAFETDPSMNDEHIQLTESAAQTDAALDADGPLFGDRPVVVLGAADTHTNWSDLPADLAAKFDKIWLDGQKALAAESTAGSFVVVPNSNHEIQAEQPAVVIQTIEDMLATLAS
jgi:pimeloyl-ACP methyl ester carboxylesterase